MFFSLIIVFHENIYWYIFKKLAVNTIAQPCFFNSKHDYLILQKFTQALKILHLLHIPTNQNLFNLAQLTLKKTHLKQTHETCFKLYTCVLSDAMAL